MRSFYFKFFGVVALFVIVFGDCKKDKPTTPSPANNTKIVTNLVTLTSDGGITLNGTVNEIPSGLTDYGFLLSTDSLFINPQRFPITTPIAVGPFSVALAGGLQKNTKYFAATYSFISGNVTMNRYNVVSFNYLGTKAPIVNSISPLKADMGDTITIKGKYFMAQQNLSVLFGTQQAIVSIPNDSVLRCVVPTALTQAAAPILFKFNNMIDTVSRQFSLNAPVVTSFTALATFRDTMIITGDHFGYQNSLNQVSIGNVAATIVSSNRKQIKALVPDNVPHSFNDVNIKAQAQTVTPATQLQIRQPVITSISLPSANINDVVTITGKYFHPVLSKNTIYSESNLAQLNSGSTTQLTYNVPNGLYPRRKATITLKLLDYTVVYTSDMTIKDKWIVVGTVPFEDYGNGGGFTINNTSYVICQPKNYTDRQQYIWKLNTSDFSWQQITIPFACTNGQVISNGSKAYVYTAAATNNFYEFDAVNNTWTQKADYPVAATRWSGTMFAIGTKVYFGLGSSTPSIGGTPVADDTFYEYNPVTNSWRKMPNYPDSPVYGARLIASAFVINNTAYVGCGATNSGMVSFYAYAQATDSWQRIHDFPDARANAVGFAVGNYGFIATGEGQISSSAHDYFKYDPNADSWTHVTTDLGCSLCGWGIDRGYVLINNGYVYIGGGGGSGSFYYLNQAIGNSL